MALVHGRVQQESGAIHQPIDRDPCEPHRRIVTPAGYPSITHYVVAARYETASLVKLRLETGRTHQIRVHMQYLGHPLIGDKMYAMGEHANGAQQLYGSGEHANGAQQLYGSGEHANGAQQLDRQALHAARLGFYHPTTKQWLEFTAELPVDMKCLIDELEAAEKEKDQ
jgi:23S rRNA pseudouridine1911/1915/1917 synthase